MEYSVAETSTCTMKYFSDASVLYKFLTLDIRGINDVRLSSRTIHALSHELEDIDTNTTLIKNDDEFCCRMRSNGKAGIFNTESGASNLSSSV